jgi:hypothetical protein
MTNRTLTDSLLWQWLQLATTSRTVYEQELYDLIIASPSFAEDSFSFCTSLVAHSRTVMLPQGCDRLLEMWTYAEGYIKM